MASGAPSVVWLNVGGQRFATTLETLRSHGDNFLSRLVANADAGTIGVLRDARGALFVDRSPAVFAVILDYLRTSQLYALPPGVSREQLMAEFSYYSIPHPMQEIVPDEPGTLPTVSDVLQGVVHFDSLEDAVAYWRSQAKAFVLQHFPAIKEGAVQRLHKQHHTSLLCYFGFSPLSDTPREVADWPLQGNFLQVPGCMNGTMALAVFVEEVANLLSYKLGMRVRHSKDHSGVHTLELQVF